MTIDNIIISFDTFLRVVTGTVSSSRSPVSAESPSLSEIQRQQSVSLLRINHVGEVCAQGLYQGQLLASRDQELRDYLHSAAQEEIDHLAWCLERLHELQAKPSALLLFWYLNSFLIGFVAGIFGDCWSLGFLEETEKQVVCHLEEHLVSLADRDHKTAQIFSTMQAEEETHQKNAAIRGAKPLPTFLRRGMWLLSRAMVFLSVRI